MKTTGQIVAGVIGLVMISQFGGPSAMAANCNLSDIVKRYQSGKNLLAANNVRGALAQWRTLADAGLGPAEREMAKLFEAGRGVAKSIDEAAFWAELSAVSGDKAGQDLAVKLRGRLKSPGQNKLAQRLKEWRPTKITCKGAKKPADRDANGLSFKVTISKRVNSTLAGNIRKQFPSILADALAGDPSARIYLSMIRVFRVYNGSRYHRYIGWQKGSKGRVMRVASGNFDDRSPEYFGRALVMTAKRRLYDGLADSTFIDPVQRVENGLKIFGSTYPDIKNPRFFRAISRALEMAKRLPPEVRKYVKIIDEVHYNPLSKYFNRGGTVDSSAAYYNKNLSSEGQRIMFVRRDVLYASPLYLLQSLVHEGTHAAQDQRARGYAQQVPRLKAALKKIKPGSKTAKNLRREIDRKADYSSRWYRGVKKGRRRIKDMSFECEATEIEIKAVQAVGGSPGALKSSGYVGVCPKAKQEINRWRVREGKKSR